MDQITNFDRATFLIHTLESKSKLASESVPICLYREATYLQCLESRIQLNCVVVSRPFFST
jgi:hypothetical protein